MPKLTPLAVARQLDQWGFNVLPAASQQKTPTVEWKRWVTSRASHMVDSWFPAKPVARVNYWVATGGVSNCYVLDIDNPAADRWWREVAQFGDVMDATVRARTAKGVHYYFWVPDDDMTKGWAYHSGGVDFDVRGAGGGVIAPPSVHESGFVYEWIQPPDPDLPMHGMQPAPDWIKSRDKVRAHLDTAATPAPAGPTEASRVELDRGPASMLSHLLAHPPAEGGRNDWLAKVAGHYAKTYRQQHDLYLVHLNQAAALLTPPLPPDEVAKLTGSIWNKEQADHPERDIEGAGWLASGGDRLLTQVRYGKGADAEYRMVEWADFDIEVRGVLARDGDESNLAYDIVLTRKRDRAKVSGVVDGRQFGQPQRLHTWLSGFGVSISRPEGTWPANPPDHVRLLRYLDSQPAPRATMTAALGWDDTSGGFLTFDGVIRPDGPHPYQQTRPNPHLREAKTVRFAYGFEQDLAEARRVLAEVLTYHDEQTAAVFGAWWAACLLKPQLQPQLALFPLMAIEAASGAGKTNGMFNLLLQLSGSLEGPGVMTYAAVRDRIAAHQSGIVWLDDLDQLGRIEELLRVTTSGESVVKKGIDNTANVVTTMRSPVVLSGEYLGLGTQKAMLDRVVLLNPPKPDSRMSVKPGREHLPQWDDIVDLTARYPVTQDGERGLTVLAGHLVAAALALTGPAVDHLRAGLRQVKKTTTGRQADKIALMLTGGWILDRLCDPDVPPGLVGPWQGRVDAWSRTSDAVLSAGEWDNRLTTEIVPWALREYGWAGSARGGVPVWVAEADDLTGPTIWVNVPTLAVEWRNHMRGRIVDRTDAEKPLLDQVRRCQDRPHSRRFDISRHPGQQRRQLLYWGLTGEVATVVLERSES